MTTPSAPANGARSAPEAVAWMVGRPGTVLVALIHGRDEPTVTPTAPSSPTTRVGP